MVSGFPCWLVQRGADLPRPLGRPERKVSGLMLLVFELGGKAIWWDAAEAAMGPDFVVIPPPPGGQDLRLQQGVKFFAVQMLFPQPAVERFLLRLIVSRGQESGSQAKLHRPQPTASLKSRPGRHSLGLALKKSVDGVRRHSLTHSLSE